MRFVNRTKKYIEKHGTIPKASKAFFKAAKRHGLVTVLKKSNEIASDYDLWISNREMKYDQNEVQREIQNFIYQPKISIIMPVYNVEEEYLRAAIDSVVNQYYENFELCIADDASTLTHIKPLLKSYAEKDSRIKVVFRKENGHISKTSNDAIKLATGEYLAFMDNDDLLKPEALFEMVKKVNEDSTLDLIYSDEDKVSFDGRIRQDPFFKPDWSPDSFLGHMYICHFVMYRKELVDKLGGLRVGYEGAQDYDLALRFTEITSKIGHVSKILYHWRMIPTSTASGSGAKNYAFEASIKAKNDAIVRRGWNAHIEADEEKSLTNFVFHTSEKDLVSIIIPTKNHGDDVKKCIDSIFDSKPKVAYEIILVDNGSDESKSLEIFKQLEKRENITILTLPIPFNYSKLNNEAVKIANGNLLLFLNNDTEVISGEWLDRLAGQALLKSTGAVGAMLYYPDDTIQHAGVIGTNNIPGHAFHGLNRGEYGYFARLLLNYNFSAVTGACLMVEKSKFEKVNGFDEENLAIAFNDVDLCYKLLNEGYYNVLRHDVELYHYESKSRGSDEAPEKKERFARELSYMQSKWSHIMIDDPFYNSNLTRENYYFTFRKNV